MRKNVEAIFPMGEYYGSSFSTWFENLLQSYYNPHSMAFSEELKK